MPLGGALAPHCTGPLRPNGMGRRLGAPASALGPRGASSQRVTRDGQGTHGCHIGETFGSAQWYFLVSGSRRKKINPSRAWRRPSCALLPRKLCASRRRNSWQFLTQEKTHDLRGPCVRMPIAAPKVYSDLRGAAPRECSANAMLDERGNADPLERREQPRPRANPDPARGEFPLTTGHQRDRLFCRLS